MNDLERLCKGDPGPARAPLGGVELDAVALDEALPHGLHGLERHAVGLGHRAGRRQVAGDTDEAFGQGLGRRCHQRLLLRGGLAVAADVRTALTPAPDAVRAALRAAPCGTAAQRASSDSSSVCTRVERRAMR